jgi:PAS domain S-box-containing protein
MGPLDPLPASELAPGGHLPWLLVRAAEATGQLFWLLDGRHPARRLYVSPTWEAVWGFSQDEVLRDPLVWIGRLHPDDRERVGRAYGAFLEGAAPAYDEEYRVGAGDEERWMRERGFAEPGAWGAGPALAVGVAHDITDLKRADEEARRLAARILEAQEEERRRIARDLHDCTAQTLLAATLDLARLESLLASRGAEARDLAAEARGLCEQALRDIRTVSHLLHPPLLDQMGLPLAVSWYAEGFARRSGLAVGVEIAPTIGRLPPDTEMALFRVLQEVLSNVHRHSGSPTASIRLARAGSEIILDVRDEGRGLRGATEGVGMSSMRERLEKVGGRLEVLSSDGGTTIRARVAGGPP